MKLLSGVFLILAPLLAQSTHPRDCSEVQPATGENTDVSQVYNIFPSGSPPAVQVYCESDRYTVILKRINALVNFNKNFLDYRNGFGDPAAEYFIGLENLRLLTTRRNYELLVRLEDDNDVIITVHYNTFSVGAEVNNYPLTVSGFTGAVAGDIMADHNGQMFINCAQITQTGFWYGCCHFENPDWFHITDAQNNQHVVGVKRQDPLQNPQLKSFTMMIHPK